MTAVDKYKAAMGSAEKKEKDTNAKLAEAKAAIQKQQVTVKQAQKDASAAAANLEKRKELTEHQGSRDKAIETDDTDRAVMRMHDTVAALGKVADKRREQLDQKRHNNTSSAWVQTLPGVPGPLRKSLWYKMHRRRQQIVLRPSQESVLLDLRHHVKQSLTTHGLISPAKPEKTGDSSQAVLEEAQTRAEQSLLLAIHPLLSRNEHLQRTPSSSSSSWAEPGKTLCQSGVSHLLDSNLWIFVCKGWHLELHVPKPITQSILPRAEVPPLVQRNLSEIHSAPGRQAASLLRTTHLKALATPLSAVAIATSLAETNPAVAISPGCKFFCGHVRLKIFSYQNALQPKQYPLKATRCAIHKTCLT
jgi:hypothetical protein